MPVSNTKTKRITIRITDVDEKWLRDQAEGIDGNISDVIRRLIKSAQPLRPVASSEETRGET